MGIALGLAIHAAGGAPARDRPERAEPDHPTSAPSSSTQDDSASPRGVRLSAQDFFWHIDLGLPMDAACYTELRCRDEKLRLFGVGRGESEFRSGSAAIEYRITPTRLEYRYIGGQGESSWQELVRGHAPGGPVFFPARQLESHGPSYWLEGDELVFADADDRAALQCTYEEVALSTADCAIATDRPAYFVVLAVENVDEYGGWTVELDGGAEHGLVVGQALWGMGISPRDYALQVIDVRAGRATARSSLHLFSKAAQPFVGSWVANEPGAGHYPTVMAIILPPLKPPTPWKPSRLSSEFRVGPADSRR